MHISQEQLYWMRFACWTGSITMQTCAIIASIRGATDATISQMQANTNEKLKIIYAEVTALRQINSDTLNKIDGLINKAADHSHEIKIKAMEGITTLIAGFITGWITAEAQKEIARLAADAARTSIIA